MSNLDKQNTTTARNLVLRSELSTTNDEKKMQTIQVLGLEEEVLDDVERFQNYGFTSHVLAGGEAIILSVGADRSHPIAIVVDDRRYRFKATKEGEVVIYTDEGDYIHLMRENRIEVKTKTLEVNAETVIVNATDVTINTDKYTVNASAISLNSSSFDVTTPDAKFSSKISAVDDIKAGSISSQKHVHTGVESGPDLSGVPKG